jgi:ketosteroid isomerase-like protein
MKNAKQLFALAIILATPVLGIAATDSDRNDLSKIYQVYAQVMKQKDLATILSFETDDFTHKLLSGKTLNRQQDAANTRQAFLATKVISRVDVQVLDLKIQSAQANVVASQILEATIVDPQGKEHTLVSKSKSRDTWVKVEGHWKIKYSEDFEGSDTIDGHPVNNTNS